MKRSQPRIKSILFSLLLLAAGLVPLRSVLAESDSSQVGDVLAPCYILVDAADPSVVHFEQAADQSCIPGSTMKIMTCIVVLENCADLSERITVPGQAARMKETNSLMNVIAGEDLSVAELLYGLMLESGNDAALTLALHFGGGTVAGFADMMNAKADEIGLSEVTHFVNASGAWKSGSNQFSTARDMAMLACYALQNETFRTIVSTATYTIPPNTVRKEPLTLINGNRLVSDTPETENTLYCEYADGVKTGSTELGGKCLAASATRDGAQVVCIMLGAKEGGSKNQRMNRVFEDTKRLMELALETKYQPLSPDDLGLTYEGSVSLPDGKTARVTADFSDVSPARLPPEDASALSANPALIEFSPQPEQALLAEANLGDPCGTVACSYGGRILFRAPLMLSDAPAEEAPAPVAALTPTPAPTETPIPNAGAPMDKAKLLVAAWAALAVVVAGGTVTLLILHRKQTKKKKRRKRRKQSA